MLQHEAAAVKTGMNSKKAKPLTARMSSDEVADMVRHGQSGAAGIHTDQNTKRLGVGKTNRVGSRSSVKREAIENS